MAQTKKSGTKKKSAHKSVRRRTASKKRAAKGTKKKARRKLRPVPGYKRRSGSGLLVPSDGSLDQAEVVSPTLLQKGITEAKDRMKDMIYDVAETLGDGYDVTQVEFEASFNADGKFMGFGVGGATSIRLRIEISEDDVEQ